MSLARRLKQIQRNQEAPEAARADAARQLRELTTSAPAEVAQPISAGAGQSADPGDYASPETLRIVRAIMDDNDFSEAEEKFSHLRDIVVRTRRTDVRNFCLRVLCRIVRNRPEFRECVVALCGPCGELDFSWNALVDKCAADAKSSPETGHEPAPPPVTTSYVSEPQKKPWAKTDAASLPIPAMNEVQRQREERTYRAPIESAHFDGEFKTIKIDRDTTIILTPFDSAELERFFAEAVALIRNCRHHKQDIRCPNCTGRDWVPRYHQMLIESPGSTLALALPSLWDRVEAVAQEHRAAPSSENQSEVRL